MKDDFRKGILYFGKVWIATDPSENRETCLFFGEKPKLEDDIYIPDNDFIALGPDRFVEAGHCEIYKLYISLGQISHMFLMMVDEDIYYHDIDYPDYNGYVSDIPDEVYNTVTVPGKKYYMFLEKYEG